MKNTSITRNNKSAQQLHEAVIRVNDGDSLKTIQNAERNEVAKLVNIAIKHNITIYKITRQHPFLDGVESKNILISLVGVVEDRLKLVPANEQSIAGTKTIIEPNGDN